MDQDDMKELTGKQQVQTRYSRNSFVFTKFEFEAFHCHPNAPKGVYFLKDVHRHVFKAHVELSTIDEEPIEAHSLKNMLTHYCQNTDMNGLSCDELCYKLHKQIVKHYDLKKNRNLGTPTRGMIIEVSEDGENGACHTYHPSNIVIGNWL